MRIGVQTGNAHKLEEFRRILDPVLPGIELVASPAPAPEETGDSFAENALIKARVAFLATGLPSIADDSGISVEALGGAPGIYSARYSPSGEDAENTALLLSNLEGVADRRAAFVCAAALVTAAGEVVVERRWEGQVASEPSGGGGFGYDPVFIPEGLDQSAAELSPERKDELSHRGQAFRELARHIQAPLGG
jgi:XTP/dITP diphosphohydrolase